MGVGRERVEVSEAAHMLIIVLVKCRALGMLHVEHAGPRQFGPSPMSMFIRVVMQVQLVNYRWSKWLNTGYWVSDMWSVQGEGGGAHPHDPGHQGSHAGSPAGKCLKWWDSHAG